MFLKPETFLLSMIQQNMDKHTKFVMIHIIMVARMIYAQFWKTNKIPDENQLIMKALNCAEMDRISTLLKANGRYENFEDGQNFINS